MQNNNSAKEVSIDDLRAKLNNLWRNESESKVQLKNDQDYAALAAQKQQQQYTSSSSLPAPPPVSSLFADEDDVVVGKQPQQASNSNNNSSNSSGTTNMQTRIKQFQAYLLLLRQEEAKQWMSAVLGEHLTAMSTRDFVDQLRDGQLLCRLVNAWCSLIAQDASLSAKYKQAVSQRILKIHQVPYEGHKMEFMMATDNVNQFFQACHRIQLPSIYLFTLPDLWERKNIAAVVHCVHALAHYLDRIGALKDPKLKIKDLSKDNIMFDAHLLRRAEQDIELVSESNVLQLLNIGDFDEHDSDHDKKQQQQSSLLYEPSLDELFAKYGYKPTGGTGNITGGFDDHGSSDSTFASAEHCKVQGLRDTVIAGELNTFTIVACNSHGKKLELGGDSFKVVLRGSSSNSIAVDAQVIDNNNGTYRVEYMVPKSGLYKLDILLDDITPLSSSLQQTIKVIAGPLSQYKILEANFDPKSGPFFAGYNYKCKIAITDKYNNPIVMDSESLQVRLVQDQLFSMKGGVSVAANNDSNNNNSNTTYDVSFTFPSVGQYDVDMRNLSADSNNSNNNSNNSSIKLLDTCQINEPMVPIYFQSSAIQSQQQPQQPQQQQQQYVIQFQTFNSDPVKKQWSPKPKYVSLIFKSPVQANAILSSLLPSKKIDESLQFLFPQWIKQCTSIRQSDPNTAQEREDQTEEDMYWRYTSVKNRDEMSDELKSHLITSSSNNSSSNGIANVLDMVQITNDYMDWSEYEAMRRKQAEDYIKQQQLKQQEEQQLQMQQFLLVNPNAFTLSPRTCAINFWTILSYMINQVKQTVQPNIRDEQGMIRLYENNSISFKQFLSPGVNAFNLVRKADIKRYCDVLGSVTKRLVFEILYEMNDRCKSWMSAQSFQFLNQMAKDSFQRLKMTQDIVDQIFKSELVIPGHNLQVELTDDMRDKAKDFIPVLKRQYLQEVLELVKQIQQYWQQSYSLTEQQVKDYSLMSTFFKLNLQDLNAGFEIVFGYEMSSKPRAILVHEIQMLLPYAKAPNNVLNTYVIHVPINQLFDSSLYKQVATCKSVRDRARVGLVNPYKCVHVRQNVILFEGFRTASLSAIGIRDLEERSAANLDNATELLRVLAANHVKRFTRAELSQLIKQNNEPLMVPVTTLSLLTPFFLNEAEDRQLVEHQVSLLKSLGNVIAVTVDLHDGHKDGPITVPVRFQEPILLNFGTNPIMKTLMLGLSYQRLLNSRKYGMRMLERQASNYLDKLLQEKHSLSRQIVAHILQQQKTMSTNATSGATSSRSVQMLASVISDYGAKLENQFQVLMRVKKEQSQKICVLELELKQAHSRLEGKLSKWIEYMCNGDSTTASLYYTTSLSFAVSAVDSIHYKLILLEALHAETVEKMEQYMLTQERFVNQIATIMTQQQQQQQLNNLVPPQWNLYYELVYKERDIYHLYMDLVELYHVKKAHESFSQGIVESQEVKLLDPYAVPIRVLILSFLLGNQVHFNCKSGKERSGECFDQIVELNEIRAQFGEYWPVNAEKKMFNEHRRTIHTSIAFNGGSLDVIRENVGFPGTKIDKAISGRFLPGYFAKYKGLAKFDRLTYASSDAMWKKICTKILAPM